MPFSPQAASRLPRTDKATRLEPGCISYDLNVSTSDPLRVTFVERWESREALNAMQQRAEEAAQLLKTLANAQRLRVLCLLVGREMTVGQINEELPELSQSALSQHLAKLRDLFFGQLAVFVSRLHTVHDRLF